MAHGKRRGSIASVANYAKRKGSAWYKYFEETSAHGISHIRSDQGYVLKVFWTFCWIVCVISFSYMIVRIIIKFRREDVGTGIEIVPGLDVEWPEIRVCWPYPVYWIPTLKALNVSDEVYALLHHFTWHKSDNLHQKWFAPAQGTFHYSSFLCGILKMYRHQRSLGVFSCADADTAWRRILAKGPVPNNPWRSDLQKIYDKLEITRFEDFVYRLSAFAIFDSWGVR